MIAQVEKGYYTPEEYLILEDKAEARNEYINGEVIPMAGGTTNHNKIALNFCRAFPLNINNQDYDIYINDVKLWIPEYQVYTYPDIIVIRDKPIYQKETPTIVTNPCLIVEVLSKSTQEYDRTDKFKFYRSLPSFQEYILISQSSYYVEQFVKSDEEQWLFRVSEGENANLKLQAIDFSLTFQQLYNKVDFELS